MLLLLAGLMSENDMVAARIEELGCRTFSTSEMALYLSSLLHPSIVREAWSAPLRADLSGRMAAATDRVQRG